MEQQPAPRPAPSHPWHWFPELWDLGRKRLRPQARLLGLSLVVGIIAGLGAVVFQTACQVVSSYSLGAVAHYHPEGPRGEPELLKDEEELRLIHILHRVLADMHPVEAMELLLKQIGKHKTNAEFLASVTLG